MPPPVRWESQGGSARWRAVSAGSRPAFRLRSRSRRSQTLEIPCPCYHGCVQKRGSQGATGPTCAAHFLPLRRSCRRFHRCRHPRQEHMRGQISGKHRTKPAKETRIPPSPTAKPARKREFAALLFALPSVSENRPNGPRGSQKCKLLLHLGNFRAFSVDNKMRLTYDFPTGTRLDRSSAIPPLPVNLWFPHGHCAKEHVCF